MGTVTSAWTRVAVTSEAQQLCSEGQDCAKAVLLYQHLHAVITQTVGAYDGGADSKYWFSEGLLSHLYQAAPHSVLDRGAEPERPSTDESVWGFWEGLLTGRSTEPELRVSSRPVSRGDQSPTQSLNPVNNCPVCRTASKPKKRPRSAPAEGLSLVSSRCVGYVGCPKPCNQ